MNRPAVKERRETKRSVRQQRPPSIDVMGTEMLWLCSQCWQEGEQARCAMGHSPSSLGRGCLTPWALLTQHTHLRWVTLHTHTHTLTSIMPSVHTTSSVHTGRWCGLVTEHLRNTHDPLARCFTIALPKQNARACVTRRTPCLCLAHEPKDSHLGEYTLLTSAIRLVVVQVMQLSHGSSELYTCNLCTCKLYTCSLYSCDLYTCNLYTCS